MESLLRQLLGICNRPGILWMASNTWPWLYDRPRCGSLPDMVQATEAIYERKPGSDHAYREPRRARKQGGARSENSHR